MARSHEPRALRPKGREGGRLKELVDTPEGREREWKIRGLERDLEDPSAIVTRLIKRLALHALDSREIRGIHGIQGEASSR